MEIYERVFLLLEKTGKTQKELSDHLLIAPNTISNWKTRKTDPPSRLILPICDFFGCSVAYLLVGHEIDNSPGLGVSFSRNDREMLKVFHKLPEYEQTLLIGHIQQMVFPLFERDDPIEKGAPGSSASSDAEAM